LTWRPSKPPIFPCRRGGLFPPCRSRFSAAPRRRPASSRSLAQAPRGLPAWLRESRLRWLRVVASSESSQGSGVGLICCLTVQLAQFRLEDFAVIVFRQGFQKHIVAGPLEARDGREAKRVQFFRRDFLLRTRHHAGHDLFAPIGMRAADHGYLEHARV